MRSSRKLHSVAKRREIRRIRKKLPLVTRDRLVVVRVNVDAVPDPKLLCYSPEIALVGGVIGEVVMLRGAEIAGGPGAGSAVSTGRHADDR